MKIQLDFSSITIENAILKIEDSTIEEDWLKDEHLVLWDGVHAPREGRVSLSFLQESKKYRFIKKFSDEKSEYFKGHFDIYLFEKI